MSDVWDTAANTETGPQKYYGQIFTDAFFVYISKGEPKVLFDPQQHSTAKRFTQVKIDGVCTKNDGTSYTISREIICEFGREWTKIVLPSLKKLGVHPRDLDDKWASWETPLTGRTWLKDGETVKGTTFKFVEFYPDEETCRTAEAAFYKRPDDGPAENLDDTMPMPEDTPVDNGPTRAELAGFLPMFWTLAGKNADAFYAKIAGDDALKNAFDSNSPEVVEIIGGAPTGFVEENDIPF